MRKDTKAGTRRCRKTLAMLAGLVLALLIGSVPVMAAEDSEIIKLTQRSSSDNTAFSVSNMFPGDSEANNYCVSVTYTDAATLYFQAEVRDGYEKLAEVLQMSVAEVADDGTQDVVYTGLIGGMTEAVSHDLTASGKTTEEVYYEITVWLDTSVGNDYVSLSLIADFTWWVETEEEEETGDTDGSEDGTGDEDTTGTEDTTQGEDTTGTEDTAGSEDTTGTEDTTGSEDTAASEDTTDSGETAASEEAAESEDTETSSEAETGDTARSGLWGTVLAAAVAVCILLIVLRRKREAGNE